MDGLQNLKEYKESFGLDGNVQYSNQTAQEAQNNVNVQGGQTAAQQQGHSGEAWGGINPPQE